MKIDLWHYNFKLRHNSVDSQHRKDFTAAEIDEIFNDAICMWTEQQYSGNNHKKTGFEVTQQRTDNLSTLVVKYPEQPALTPTTNSTTDVFEFDLNDLVHPYLHMIRVQGKASGCANNISIKIVQHDDLNYYLTDPYKKPSNGAFPRLIANFGKSTDANTETSLYVYTDGTFSIDSITPEYIKVPTEVTIGGYTDIDGQQKVRTESDIADKYHSQIIDIAVDEARRIIGDPNLLQHSSQKQLINE